MTPCCSALLFPFEVENPSSYECLQLLQPCSHCYPFFLGTPICGSDSKNIQPSLWGGSLSIHLWMEHELKIAASLKSSLLQHFQPVFPPHARRVCSYLSNLLLTEGGLEIELVSRVYFPQIHIMKYSTCPPTSSSGCASSFPV